MSTRIPEILVSEQLGTKFLHAVDVHAWIGYATLMSRMSRLPSVAFSPSFSTIGVKIFEAKTNRLAFLPPAAQRKTSSRFRMKPGTARSFLVYARDDRHTACSLINHSNGPFSFLISARYLCSSHEPRIVQQRLDIHRRWEWE